MGGERFDHWIQREKERDIHRDRKTYTHRHRQTDTHAHTITHTHTHTHNHTHTHRQSRSHASPSGRTGSRGYIHRGGQEPRRRGRELSRQNGKKQNTCGGSRGRRGQRGGRVSVGRSLCSASSRHRRIHVAKRPDEVMCVSTRMYVRACIRTYTHTCTRHACIHTFKHTHTHQHIQGTRSWRQSSGIFCKLQPKRPARQAPFKSRPRPPILHPTPSHTPWPETPASKVTVAHQAGESGCRYNCR